MSAPPDSAVEALGAAYAALDTRQGHERRTADVMECVRRGGEVRRCPEQFLGLQFARDAIQGDRDVVLVTVEQDALALLWAREAATSDRDRDVVQGMA